MLFFAERFNESIRNLPKKFVFERGDANWIDVLPTITKQYNIRIHSSTKLNRIQASLKKNEGFVCNILLDKRKKMKRRFQVNGLARTAGVKRTFSKGDTTNWSYKLYKITQIVKDTIPSYKIYQRPQRYKEALLKKNRVIIERKRCYEKIKLELNQNVSVHHCL